MRPLKLHTKTTALASAITVAVLASVLAIINARVAVLVREEQKALAELQAVNLAEQIRHLPAPRDPQAIARAATLVRGSRPGIVAVRVWERVGGVFVETAAAGGSAPAEEIPDETKAALRSGQASRLVSVRPTGANESFYRVLAPISEDGRYSGAVEVVEQLDDAPSIAVRYEQYAIWMALLAVALITLSIYMLFRQLIYQPIGRLLQAMSRAEAGDLHAQAPPRAGDEIGLLSRGFNRMIERIREMTDEREARRRVLQERVHEATAELQQRNEQLEETNRELWRTTRRLTDLERLAAAGQTAAQFAHEVGTPLNLISGHVQLLRAQLSHEPRAESRLEIINAQIERIERIVRTMLDRTRPEALSLAPVNLNETLQSIFDATAPALEARGVRLKAELAASLPSIDGDEDRLQQVFINLINNALDAMPDGGQLRVRTCVEEEAGQSKEATQRNTAASSKNARRVLLEFADTGCGMTEAMQAHIFAPLYTTKEPGQGTGLGLAVVQQVMREHGGEIEVESRAGEGACFRLSFPQARAESSPASEDVQRTEAEMQSVGE